MSGMQDDGNVAEKVHSAKFASRKYANFGCKQRVLQTFYRPRLLGGKHAPRETNGASHRRSFICGRIRQRFNRDGL
jgi:hypothetical protein